MCGQGSRAIPSLLGILEGGASGRAGRRIGTGGEKDIQIYWNPGVTPGLLPTPALSARPPPPHTHTLTLTHASSLTRRRCSPKFTSFPVVAERPLVTTACTPQLWLKREWASERGWRDTTPDPLVSDLPNRGMFGTRMDPCAASPMLGTGDVMYPCGQCAHLETSSGLLTSE